MKPNSKNLKELAKKINTELPNIDTYSLTYKESTDNIYYVISMSSKVKIVIIDELIKKFENYISTNARDSLLNNYNNDYKLIEGSPEDIKKVIDNFTIYNTIHNIRKYYIDFFKDIYPNLQGFLPLKNITDSFIVFEYIDGRIVDDSDLTDSIMNKHTSNAYFNYKYCQDKKICIHYEYSVTDMLLGIDKKIYFTDIEQFSINLVSDWFKLYNRIYSEYTDIRSTSNAKILEILNRAN